MGQGQRLQGTLNTSGSCVRITNTMTGQARAGQQGRQHVQLQKLRVGHMHGICIWHAWHMQRRSLPPAHLSHSPLHPPPRCVASSHLLPHILHTSFTHTPLSPPHTLRILLTPACTHSSHILHTSFTHTPHIPHTWHSMLSCASVS